MTPASSKRVRCAIYTRVSTDQGLDQDFNSLDAQYDACPFRKLYPDIMVVQPRQDWDGDNGTGPLDCPTCGRVFAQRQVRAHLIVIGRIRRKNLPQMRLA